MRELVDIKKMLVEWGDAFVLCEMKMVQIRKINNLIGYTRDLKALGAAKDSYAAGVYDPTYEAVEKIVDGYDVEIERLRDGVGEILNNKARVDSLMENLEPVEREILLLKFVRKFTWDVVARKMNYSKRHCCRIYRAALEKLCCAGCF